MSHTGEHVSATPGAWAAVFLIILAFILGTFALIAHSLPLWIAAGAAVVLGGAAGIRSKIMEQAY